MGNSEEEVKKDGSKDIPDENVSSESGEESSHGDEQDEEASSEDAQGSANPYDRLLNARNGRDADFSVFENEAPTGSSGGKSGSSGDVAALQAELREANEKYLRALADFENFKKRAVKERSDLLKYQGERVFQDLLTIIDNFDRAIESAEDENTEMEEGQFKEGIQLIHKMFLQMLEKWEVRGESAVGQVFDPNKHEAISQMPSADQEAGTVLNQLEKTYFFKDKLIRPAKVVVAVAPPDSESAKDEADSK